MMDKRQSSFSRSDGIADWRSILGTSTALWVGDGRRVVEPGWWIALSGCTSVDYNVAVCHGGDVTAAILRSLQEVKTAEVPALIMLAGSGLAGAQQLADEGWVCVGATPLMVCRNLPQEDDDRVQKLSLEHLEEARSVIRDAFDVPAGLSWVALPDEAVAAPAFAAWGLYEKKVLSCCVATVTVDGAIVIWSMATPRHLQHQGYGNRLLRAVLARSSSDGANSSLLYASPSGEPLYRSLGYEVIEHWQMWSRPRWVPGRI